MDKTQVTELQDALRCSLAIYNLAGFCEVMKIDRRNDEAYALDKFLKFSKAASALCNFDVTTLSEVLTEAQHRMNHVQ